MGALQTFQSLLSAVLIATGAPSTQPSKPLNAIYDGVMRSPKARFGIDSSYMTIEIDERNIVLTQDHFFGEVCIYEGSLEKSLSREDSALSAAGTYRCSDFTDGTWTSDYIKGVGGDSFVAELNILLDDFEYLATYTGFSPQATEVDINNSHFFSAGTDISGAYEGVMKSTDTCAGYSFTVSSTEIAVAIEDQSISFTQDAFYEGECRFTGTVTESFNDFLKASGTYMCSNFDEGTWSSNSLGLTSPNTLLAEINVDVPDRGCGYTVRYAGIRY